MPAGSTDELPFQLCLALLDATPEELRQRYIDYAADKRRYEPNSTLLRFPEFVYFTAIRSVQSFAFAHTSLTHQILTTGLADAQPAAASAPSASSSSLTVPHGHSAHSHPAHGPSGGPDVPIAACAWHRYAHALGLASRADAAAVFALLAQVADRCLLAKAKQEEEEAARRQRGVSGVLSRVFSAFGDKDKDKDKTGAAAGRQLVVGAGHALRPVTGAITYATFSRFVAQLHRLSEARVDTSFGLRAAFGIAPVSATAAGTVSGGANSGGGGGAGAAAASASAAAAAAAAAAANGDDDSAAAADAAAAAAAAAAVRDTEKLVLAWPGAKIKSTITNSNGSLGTDSPELISCVLSLFYFCGCPIFPPILTT